MKKRLNEVLRLMGELDGITKQVDDGTITLEDALTHLEAITERTSELEEEANNE